jgi:Tfp pilus assembly protein PilN
VTIFNKRNALVGFLTLKWLQQRRRRKQRNALKIAALGVVSLGVLAGLGAVLVRRQRSEPRLFSADSGDGAEGGIVGEVVT